jgi:hypothetical protein
MDLTSMLLECCWLSACPLEQRRQPTTNNRQLLYRFEVPRAIFLTLRFALPRAPVRFAFGAAFLRAVRFAFLRSSFESELVFAMVAFQ